MPLQFAWANYFTFPRGIHGAGAVRQQLLKDCREARIEIVKMLSWVPGNLHSVKGGGCC